MNRKKSKDYFTAISIIVVLAIVGVAVLINSTGTEDVEINESEIVLHFFYLRTCPHCKDQEEFHPFLEKKYPNLRIIEYDIAKSSSREKYYELANAIGMDTGTINTPTTFIGDDVIVGFGTPETTGIEIANLIEKQIELKNE
jgi:glutaredoxin